MSANISVNSLLRFHIPWWMPFLSLFLTLYGIFFLHWNLRPIIFLFWWEVILMVGAAMIRMLFAMDSGGIFHNLGLKILLLLSGTVMGGAMIAFAIVFSFRVFEDTSSATGMAQISTQVNLLTMGYALGLAFHYFLNGKFKTAHPASELIATLAHLLILLAFLQVLTMHLIPKYPQLDQAFWVGIAVVVMKFTADYLFVHYRNLLPGLFSPNKN
jgi:hypothetical protein